MALGLTLPFSAQALDVSPWFWTLHEPWAALPERTRFPSAAELSALYAARRTDDVPKLAFADATLDKPRSARKPIRLDTLYEGRIVERAEVPQRPNDWHDLFNALAFMVFPRAKHALHRRQYDIMRARIAPTDTRLPGARTREQDALALFDEGGVVIVARPEVAPELDVESDDIGAATLAAVARGDALLVPFGHALHEHLVAGLPCPLAMPHVVCARERMPSGRAAWLSALDRALAEDLANAAYFRVPARSKGLALTAFPAALHDAFTP